MDGDERARIDRLLVRGRELAKDSCRLTDELNRMVEELEALRGQPQQTEEPPTRWAQRLANPSEISATPTPTHPSPRLAQ
jgi:hypothetical protein